MSELYKACAGAVRQIVTRNVGLKSAVYGSVDGPQKRLLPKIMKVTTAVIDNYATIKSTMTECGLITDLPDFPMKKQDRKYDKTNSSSWVQLIYSYEYLFNPDGIQGGGTLKNAVVNKLKTKFRRPGKLRTECKQKSHIRKYLRIDIFKISRDVVIERLQKELKITARKDDVFDDIVWITNDDCRKLHDFELIKDATVAIMDKASCVSGHASDVGKGACVIDACAAPGSKSLHFLSKMEGEGLLICVEKDSRRFGELQARLSDSHYFARCETISAYKDLPGKSETIPNRKAKKLTNASGRLVCLLLQEEFTHIRSCGSDVSNCTCADAQRVCLNNLISNHAVAGCTAFILSIDPSCSGSGLSSDPGRKSEMTGERLKKLSDFQKKMLKHGVGFRFIQTILYSTCSLYGEENEYVVESVTSQKHSRFRAVKPEVKWENASFMAFESELYPSMAHWKDTFVRASPEVNHTRGFFLAKLAASV